MFRIENLDQEIKANYMNDIITILEVIELKIYNFKQIKRNLTFILKIKGFRAC
jgi:hypothetical protein